MDAFKYYKRSWGEFSDDHMSLALLKWRFSDTDLPMDRQRIWSRIDKDTKPNDDRRNKLARHIFAVVTNSAGCEPAFSNFGITHAKLPNNHKTVMVGLEQQRADREAGFVHNRRKQEFGKDLDDTTATDLPPPDSSTTDTRIQSQRNFPLEPSFNGRKYRTAITILYLSPRASPPFFRF